LVGDIRLIEVSQSGKISLCSFDGFKGHPGERQFADILAATPAE
jgi:hypothetical protein